MWKLCTHTMPLYRQDSTTEFLYLQGVLGSPHRDNHDQSRVSKHQPEGVHEDDVKIIEYRLGGSLTGQTYSLPSLSSALWPPIPSCFIYSELWLVSKPCQVWGCRSPTPPPARPACNPFLYDGTLLHVAAAVLPSKGCNFSVISKFTLLGRGPRHVPQRALLTLH